MYPCLFRFFYHKIITLLITKCFEGGSQVLCILTVCNQLLVKETVTKSICILASSCVIDGEALLINFLINFSLYSA